MKWFILRFPIVCFFVFGERGKVSVLELFFYGFEYIAAAQLPYTLVSSITRYDLIL